MDNFHLRKKLRIVDKIYNLIEQQHSISFDIMTLQKATILIDDVATLTGLKNKIEELQIKHHELEHQVVSLKKPGRTAHDLYMHSIKPLVK